MDIFFLLKLNLMYIISKEILLLIVNYRDKWRKQQWNLYRIMLTYININSIYPALPGSFFFFCFLLSFLFSTPHPLSFLLINPLRKHLHFWKDNSMTKIKKTLKINQICNKIDLTFYDQWKFKSHKYFQSLAV